ncbi:hypothetical protein AB996_2165 [Lactococcus cremoris]|uniref:DUF443 family protein n=1 Tax=Lactococcus lactis subsp. cremoris TaxID=1359 RepID=A0A161VZR2_LACLC|nr:hypothetical protein [Lactococcus cremoris]KZK04955.1 hypothetical protein AB996_2165 [Lactococcus cremoris]
MVIPLTKIWFVADYWGKSELSNTKIFAEYDILKKEVVWKKFSSKSMKKQGKIFSRIINFLPLTSPFIIVPFVGFLANYTKKQATPAERLGNLNIFAPFLIGIILFLVFEYFMLYRRRNLEIVSNPTKHNQYTYFEELYEHSVRSNDAVGKYKTPYLVSGLAIIFLIVIAIPIMFWLYSMNGTLGEFIIKLLILSFLLSTLLSTIWNGVIKSIITKNIMNALNKEMETQND